MRKSQPVRLWNDGQQNTLMINIAQKASKSLEQILEKTGFKNPKEYGLKIEGKGPS